MKQLPRKISTDPAFMEFEGDRYFMFRRDVSGVRRGLTDTTRIAFRTEIEPWGVYMLERDFKRPWFSSPQTHYGAVRYEKALFIEHTNWKDELSRQFGGATGKILSGEIRQAGYDLVVTYDRYGLSEVCALDESKISRFSPYQAYQGGANLDDIGILCALESIPTTASRKDLMYVDHGRCLPITQDRWDREGEAVLRKALKAGFETITLTSPWHHAEEGKDILRAHRIVCPDPTRLISCDRPLWYEKGYSNDLDLPPLHTATEPKHLSNSKHNCPKVGL
ncbi:hypothetical protein CL689_02640 [Candidatus Saccharibacteria bacterium]|nr:hypothetical protein [Candidatus Saccharibacteria bacterium]